ncbi:MAG: hypothetical protein IJ704_04840 [Bacilli bacterium]|nr:hypothetical protein [Bacilli bacterium]
MKTKILLLFIFFSYGFVLYHINVENHEYYTALYQDNMENYTYGFPAPRGRILDRNGVVLVDNVGVLNIVYHKPYQVTIDYEIELSQKLSKYVSDVNVTETQKKNYYLLTHENGKSLITQEEWDLWEQRKLSNEEIKEFKWNRISSDMIEYSLEEEKVIYLFSKMNEGYSYQDKVLLREVSEEVASEIILLEESSLRVEVSSKREYPYGDTLRSIFGGVGSIQEDVSRYLSLGYAMDDKVGISGIEKEYESILRGKKAKYYINSDNSLTLVEEEEAGRDVVLNLDINVQLQLESILKEEMELASKKKSSKFFHDSYAMVGNPSTGGIVAIAGLRRLDNGDYQDITITSFTSSFAMGSVVKGASNTVGYITGAIEVGKKIKDSCVKLYSQNQKCSYTRLGYVDDITALKTSSNYYQFVTAIASTGQQYRYNMVFDVNQADFDTYRNIFSAYGLGSKTEIDFPKEELGMKGEKVAGDLLLNFAIGQYDTYTPIMLLQYINTISNRGNRYALRFKKEEYNTFLNQVPLENSYYDRIIEGMYEVFHGGTASSYVNKKYESVGKTGTSETFYDQDFDGVVDTQVINSTVAFFYPRENPLYSVVVVAPYLTDSSSYTYPFTKNVSLKLTNYLSIP